MSAVILTFISPSAYATDTYRGGVADHSIIKLVSSLRSTENDGEQLTGVSCHDGSRLLEQEWGEGAAQRSFGLDGQLKLDLLYRLTHFDSATEGATGASLWNPVNCTAQQTVAIIIPFRDRYDNLTVFLKHMHPFLRHQKVAYSIYVVEQASLWYGY
ncbi:unnamed protein product [Dibothriocephalus latus]|uniref:Galactosyltransferase N-terminal domain-containing protein n=1 Tax=Dibothriocephalus latus TaxID=60516 RepID=A0A3P7LBM9_DIBLA|nr:unnamed protein product [Dibothriocephalus latus]